MPVELTILSGSRQGERIELPDRPFDVGSRATDAICFSVDTDPAIANRRASCRLETEGWRIRSTGESPIFINHDTVGRAQALRSGDIIRMSEDGPDLAFALIARMSPSAKPTKQHNAVAECSAPNVTPSSSEAEPLDAERSDIKTRGVLGVMVVGLLCIGLLVAWSRTIQPSTPDPPARPKLAPIAALSIDEELLFTWRPEVVDVGVQDGTLKFTLGDDVPDGMKIDEETGTIRWTPSEAQGPQELKVQLHVSATSQDVSTSTSDTLFIVVNEVNEPPVLDSIANVTINLLETSTFTHAVRATDPDVPAQELSYGLRPDAPTGMTIDAQTGVIAWEATDENIGQTLEVAVTVSDNANRPLATQEKFEVSVVSPNPLDFAAKHVEKSVYLVGGKPSELESFFPLGTACAVADNLLVTSAAVATGIAKAREVNWDVVIVQASSIQARNEQTIPIIQAKIHQGYADADDAGQQAFFDLGLIMVGRALPDTCSLASAKDLAEIATNQTLGCLGFTITETALTRFDNPAPNLQRLDVSRVLTPDGDSGPVRLLELVGDVPQSAFGSVIFNAERKLVGIYSVPGQVPEGDENHGKLHYAPISSLVEMQLKASAPDKHWVLPQVLPLQDGN